MMNWKRNQMSLPYFLEFRSRKIFKWKYVDWECWVWRKTEYYCAGGASGAFLIASATLRDVRFEFRIFEFDFRIQDLLDLNLNMSFNSGNRIRSYRVNYAISQPIAKNGSVKNSFGATHQSVQKLTALCSWPLLLESFVTDVPRFIIVRNQM